MKKVTKEVVNEGVIQPKGKKRKLTKRTFMI